MTDDDAAAIAATHAALRAGHARIHVPVDFQARTADGHVRTRVRGSYPLTPGAAVRLVDRLEQLEADGTISTHDVPSGLVTVAVDWGTMTYTGPLP